MLRPVMFFTALALSTSAAAHGGGLNAGVPQQSQERWIPLSRQPD